MELKSGSAMGDNTISRMPTNHEAGYGPGYVSEDFEGTRVIFWKEEGYWSNFYMLKADSIDEAYEHAVVTLCDEWEPDDQAKFDALVEAQDWDELDSMAASEGAHMGPNGEYRYDESLRMLMINEWPVKSFDNRW